MNRWTPHATVASVVARDGHYLMVEEDKGGAHTVFNQPAGHLEAGETLEHAALRETLEESAWQVHLTGYLGLYINTASTGITYHSHTFLAEPVREINTPLDEGIVAAHWLTLDDIKMLETQQRLRSPLVMARLLDANAGQCFPLSIIREQTHPLQT
ncbi:NUDIX domain-containing protein [Phytohalomonas tamaricis]|uniref:NUDIX domain-containing protein n=1 Tax=Phytohalomonas tamaricis TaxID=2081032 RepID=UPI000D0B1142|nr:NUDIX hydrolase [Phytohalomonas tamaricis]